jgi:hypothetical protein
LQRSHTAGWVVEREPAADESARATMSSSLETAQSTF